MTTPKTAAPKAASATKKSAAPKAPAKATATKQEQAPKKAVPAKKAASLPAKRSPARAPALRSPSMEATLARVEAVRLAQREDGHFDCFGKAGGGYCDQGGCAYHDECLSVSRLLHAV